MTLNHQMNNEWQYYVVPEILRSVNEARVPVKGGRMNVSEECQYVTKTGS